MLKRIFRQRRRLFFGLFFSSLSFIMSNAVYGVPVPLWFSAVKLAIWIAIMLTGSLFVVILLPRWRSLIEVLGLAMFFNEVLEIAVPAIHWIKVDSGLAGAAITFLGVVAAKTVLFGKWSDRLPVWLEWSTKSSFESPLSTQQMWEKLIPGESDTKNYWTGLLDGVQSSQDDPNSIDVQYRIGSSAFQHQTITFLEEHPFTHCRYFYTADVSEKNADFVEGIYEVRLTESPYGGCGVEIENTRTAIRPRFGLACWLDDLHGDETDSISARIRNKRDWTITGKWLRDVGETV